jgi:hypothetical protein
MRMILVGLASLDRFQSRRDQWQQVFEFLALVDENSDA